MRTIGLLPSWAKAQTGRGVRAAADLIREHPGLTLGALRSLLKDAGVVSRDGKPLVLTQMARLKARAAS